MTNRGCILSTTGAFVSPPTISSKVFVACDPISYFGTKIRNGIAGDEDLA